VPHRCPSPPQLPNPASPIAHHVGNITQCFKHKLTNKRKQNKEHENSQTQRSTKTKNKNIAKTTKTQKSTSHPQIATINFTEKDVKDKEEHQQKTLPKTTQQKITNKDTKCKKEKNTKRYCRSS